MKARFLNLSEIETGSVVGSQRLAVTIDIDWAVDEVIEYSIGILERKGIKATWFVTHETRLVDRLRENPLFEVGIHPNFNRLLMGDAQNGANVEEVVDRLLEIVPEANCVRSHSLVQSERLIDVFKERGLSRVSNFFLPCSQIKNQQPWFLWNNMMMIPHGWQDNVSMMMNGSIQAPDLDLPFLCVNFHPIHVFLNSDRMERYEATRSIHRDPKKLWEKRWSGYGAERVLAEFIGRKSDVAD